jgi:hypothetical protein
VPGAIAKLRSRFPTGRLYVVCDNFSPHHKQQVRDWCADHDVELTSLLADVRPNQQDQPQQTPEDQVQQRHRHPETMSDQRSPLVSDSGRTSVTPQVHSRTQRQSILGGLINEYEAAA